MLDLFQKACRGLELYFHENYKSLSNLWAGGGGQETAKKKKNTTKQTEKKNNKPTQRPAGGTTEILLEQNNAEPTSGQLQALLTKHKRL